MHPRASELIRTLDLQPHPEGGFYRETWRSASRIRQSGRPERSALTTIYFLLAEGTFSAWHRVLADEIWHLYEGGPLELLVAAPDFSTLTRHRLGQLQGDERPVVTVATGWWQAARPLGGYALCGCTVAPGFEFEDFMFLRDDPAARASMCEAAPELANLL